MVAFGSKALPLRRPRAHNSLGDILMGDKHKSYKQSRGKEGMSRRLMEKNIGFDGSHTAKNSSRHVFDKSMKSHKSLKHRHDSATETLVCRKQVDPETTKYFTEIANVLEGSGVDAEERLVICVNALEESRGKELELSTDYILSHTFQMLLEGSDLDHLCGFLQGCAKDFPFIAMDRSGSHVVETALKSLAVHLQDEEAHSVIEETLTSVCKVITANPFELMCNCHGSHVLRSLLCLCKGLSLDSTEFHVTKSSTVLAGRLNFKAPLLDGNDAPHLHPGFPNLLKFIVLEMLKHVRKDIKSLQVNQYSSLVLQTALKLLVGDEKELLHIIPLLLGCNKEKVVEGSFIETTAVPDIINLTKETAFSHLMEVVLEVAPDNLYNEMLMKVFRNSLFDISSHHCGNFVVQALVSHVKSPGQMEFIWEELGPKFTDLIGMGRSGVIASLVAATQRLHTHEHKCCQALAAAVCPGTESPKFIVPRLLFLESYFGCEDKSSWNWMNGAKMHVIGSLILQAVFKFSSEFIQPYITSITSMEAVHLLETAKDPGGARVIEAFLSSNASVKQKRKLVLRLKGHFAEISMHLSGSFTIEKCFSACSISLREAIVSELLAVRTELFKTRQGPHLLRKLDVDGYAARPDQWKSKQASRQSVYKEFYDTFATSESKSSKSDKSLVGTSCHASQTEMLKKMRKEIDHAMDDGLRSKTKKQMKKKSSYGTETAAVGNDMAQTRGKRKSSQVEKMEKKRRREVS